MKLSREFREFGKLVRRTATVLFFSLGLAYSQEMAMNQKIQSNNPAYIAVMDSIITNSSSSFLIESDVALGLLFAKCKANGYTVGGKTPYTNVIEYGSAVDAFSGQTYDYASDPFNCNIYRIRKEGEIVAWVIKREIKRPLMNEFGQPDPFNSYTDIEMLIFFALTQEGEKIKALLGF